MGKIKNIFLDYFDLYGRQNFFTFKQKQLYNTLCGVFVSLFFLILFIIFIIYYLFLLFSRKNYTIITTVENNQEEIISLNNSIFYFGLKDNNNNILNLSDYIDIEFKYYYSLSYFYEETNRKYNEKIFYSSNCENINLYFQNINNNLKSLLCLNLSNSNFSIDFQGNSGTNNYSFFNIKITKKKDFSFPIEFFLVYFINEIDYSNYKNPLNSIIKIKSFDLYNDYYLNYLLPINKIVFESDDTLFMVKSKRKYHYYDFDNILLKSSILTNEQNIFNLLIENSNNIKKIKRNYLKFDEILAKWQSLCDSLYVVFGGIFGSIIEKIFILDKINLLFFYVNKKNEALKNSQIKFSKISIAQSNISAPMKNNQINLNNSSNNNHNNILNNKNLIKIHNKNKLNKHKTEFKIEIINYIFPLYFFKKNENIKVFKNLTELMDEIFSIENFYNLVNKSNNINLKQSNNFNGDNSSILVLSNNDKENINNLNNINKKKIT